MTAKAQLTKNIVIVELLKKYIRKPGLTLHGCGGLIVEQQN